MKQFFFRYLDSLRAAFVVWTRSTSVERLTNSLSWAEATARAHEQARTPCLCHLLLEKSRLFKHWLFSMVGWLTEAAWARRVRGDASVARRCSSCVFFMVVGEIPWDEVGSTFLGEWENQQLWRMPRLRVEETSQDVHCRTGQESNDCMLISYGLNFRRPPYYYYFFDL